MLFHHPTEKSNLFCNCHLNSCCLESSWFSLCVNNKLALKFSIALRRPSHVSISKDFVNQNCLFIAYIFNVSHFVACPRIMNSFHFETIHCISFWIFFQVISLLIFLLYISQLIASTFMAIQFIGRPFISSHFMASPFVVRHLIASRFIYRELIHGDFF